MVGCGVGGKEAGEELELFGAGVWLVKIIVNV